MLPSILLLLLYALGVAAAATAALWLRRRIPPGALVAFALLPLLFVAPGVFGARTILPTDHALLTAPWEAQWRSAGIERHNPYLNDAIMQFAPWAKAVRMAWEEGTLPLRDRWNGCGMSLAANGQSAAFAPWNVALFLLPLAKSFTLLSAVKLLIALTGTWLWLRELGVLPAAAAFGAVAFSLSFTMTPWLLFPQSAVFCVFPWALFLLERLPDAGVRNRTFALLVAVFTCFPLLGHVESVASCAFFGAFWLVARAAMGEYPRTLRLWARIVLAAVLALGLSAFSLVPQALAIFASNRLVVAKTPFWTKLFSWAPHWGVWPAAILTLFPRLPGDGIVSDTIPGSPASFPEMGLAHFGAVGAACAFLTLRPGSPRRRATAVLWLMVIASLGAASGLWPFAELVGHVPAAKLMFPIRWLSWAAVAGAAIGALELDRYCRDAVERRSTAAPLWLALGATAALAAAAFIGFRRYYEPAGIPGPRFSAVLPAIAALGAAALACAACRLLRLTPEALVLSLTVVLAGELFFQGERLYRFGRAEHLFPDTPLTLFLRSQPGVFRVVGEGPVLFPNSNVFAGVEDVRTHDPVERRDYVEFLDGCCGYDPTAYFKEVRRLDAPALDRLNVRFLVAAAGRESPAAKWKLVYSGADGAVFENAAVLPRVFPAGGAADGVVTGYRETTNTASFRLETTAEKREILLLTSLVQDGGWSARDDRDRAIETARGDGPFVSFRVRSGSGIIRLRYRPPGFAFGVVTTVATAALLAVAALFRRRRRAAARV